jgi:hypothetical protein
MGQDPQDSWQIAAPDFQHHIYKSALPEVRPRKAVCADLN